MADVSQKNEKFKVNNNGNIKIHNTNESLKFVKKEDKKGKFVQLRKENIIKIGIKDDEGKPTGEFLEFDMDDIELPLRLSKCEYLHRKNMIDLRNKFIIIDKKQDRKGEFLISFNEEEKIKALKEYYSKEEEALDLFLGKNGCKKMLSGRKPYYSMYEDIEKALEPILPIFKKVSDNINELVEKKYSDNEEGIILE